MNCPDCGEEMQPGFIYVRGMGGSLFWSKSKDIGFMSREGLEQIDLSKLSVSGTGTQAVVPGYHCDTCKTVSFKSE